MAQCATTALAGAVPRPCVRGARGRFGGFRPVPGVVSLPFPPSRPACPVLRVAGRPVRVSLTLARWYAIPRGLYVLCVRSGCTSGSPRGPFACVCARAPAASAPPPRWVVWCAHLARSRHLALVGPFHVVRAPPRVLPRSLPPSGVLGGGGRSGPGSPLVGLGLWGWRKGVPGGGAFHCCEGRLGSGAPPPPTARPLGGLLGSAIHVLWARACGCGGPTLSTWPARPVGAACRRAGPWRSCAGGRAGGGGNVPCPPFARPGGACRAGGRSASFRPSAFPGQATKRVSLASFCPWGGVAPHTTLVRARPPSLGAICAASWRVNAGSLVLRGSCGSRRLGRGGGPRSGSSLGRGGAGPAPLPRGLGAGAPAACGPLGGWGGGGRAAASLLPLWVVARGTQSWPPSCRRRTPLRRARAVEVAGPPRGGGG